MIYSAGIFPSRVILLKFEYVIFLHIRSRIQGILQFWHLTDCFAFCGHRVCMVACNHMLCMFEVEEAWHHISG